MQDQFSIEVSDVDGAGVLALAGELDLSSGSTLEQALERLLSGDARQVIVDLRQLEFMDSTGLSILIKAQQRAEQGGKRLALVKGPPQVQRLLTLTGVAERIPFADSVDELIA